MPNFYIIHHSSRNISISSLGGHIAISGSRSLSHFIWGHFLWTRYGRKPQNCRWNFDAIYDSSRDVCISGLDGDIAIFGCRSLSQSFGHTFFDVAVVGELDFITWITTILILDLFCHINHHDHNISSVSKKIHTCLMSCQTTFGAPIGDLIFAFCTHFIGLFSKVTKGQRPTLNRFLLTQKLI